MFISAEEAGTALGGGHPVPDGGEVLLSPFHSRAQVLGAVVYAPRRHAQGVVVLGSERVQLRQST